MLSDKALMERIQVHDEAAFNILFARYQVAVRQYIMRKVHNPTDAEDLVQRVFWRVWQCADQWIPHGEFSAWLYKIAKNLALNHLRTLNRRKEQPIESAPHTADEAGEHFTTTPFWMADPSAVQPDKALEQAEQSELIHQLVDRLPEAKRKVINLIYYSDLSIEQTAQVLHLLEGTILSPERYEEIFRKPMDDDLKQRYKKYMVHSLSFQG